MKRSIKIYIVCLIITLPYLSFAQDGKLITGTFSGSFEEVIIQLESASGYQFYYNLEWVDTTSIVFSVERKLLYDVLDKLVTGTKLRYFIIEKQLAVYLTSGREILTELPPGLGKKEEQVTGNSNFFDYSDYESRDRKQKSAEEKIFYIGSDTGDRTGYSILSGKISEVDSGEPVIGAMVMTKNSSTGAFTNEFGVFSLALVKGRHEIQIKSLGMKSTKRQIMLYSDGKLNVELEQEVTPLKEVTIQSGRDLNVDGLQIGLDRLDIKTMRQIPLALGETDIIKAILTLPGVQTVGEGTVGLNVRGGATDQNLILYNDAVVYNPSHLFGFFSTFNPDVIKSVELYKSGITADFGGRLSSILDVHMREGNAKKFSGSAGISPITMRLVVEGPIKKDITSFLVGFRSTYSDWLLNKVKYKDLQNSTASFYDVNLGVTHKIDDKNNLYFSGYLSKDKFGFSKDTTYAYSDRNMSVKWKHDINNKLYSVLKGTFSEYVNEFTNSKIPTEAFVMSFGIRQLGLYEDINFFLNNKHTITAGLGFTRYSLAPGKISPAHEESLVVNRTINKEQGLESAIYVGDSFDATPKLSIYGGFRYSLYFLLGSNEFYKYASDQPLRVSSIIDTVLHKGGVIKNYHGIEPRFSIRYLLAKSTSIKASYNRMRQYIQMLTNNTAIAPTDTWKLSDVYFKPQVGDQYAVGFYKNLKKIETSIEAYYRITQETIDYKDGAELLLNDHLETEILDAQGKAYGIEFLIKKNSGKLNGWVSYTYSRSWIKTSSPYKSENVNDGEFYPTNYDKPHAVNFIGNYKISRRFNFSINVVYSTGRPITVPLLKYDIGGVQRVYYSDRNEGRIPDYFRTDVSINIEGNHRIEKLAHGSWTLAVYNLFGRNNPYSVYFNSVNGVIKGYQLSIFAYPVPTLTYNLKF